MCVHIQNTPLQAKQCVVIASERSGGSVVHREPTKLTGTGVRSSNFFSRVSSGYPPDLNNCPSTFRKQLSLIASSILQWSSNDLFLTRSDLNQ